MSEASQGLDTPFWRFSLAVYGREGVADECLALQESFGIDVNLLLLCVYMGAVEGVAMSSDDVVAAAHSLRGWHDEIVRALRQARRALKPWEAIEQGPFADQAKMLRLRVKAAELDAERIEQAMLWEWSRAHSASWRRVDVSEALAANVRTLLVLSGVDEAQANPAQALPRLLRAALQASET